MTESERNLLARARTGIAVTAADVCATIDSLAELAGYEAAMKAAAAMDGEVLQAIMARRRQLRGTP
jgi:hypothetical protein